MPSAIVERVEVLKDGASSIYGSDAIADVVNIITRSDFDGAEVNAYVDQYARAMVSAARSIPPWVPPASAAIW
ncbi:outer membrane receptor protein involved in Fe transport [Xanthomonas campestris]|nr:outer membrane receptor protein involved in Fe transport [Xanthomonas sp. 3075]